MPDKKVLLILNRAFVDEQFRQQLEADLEGTVRSMGLELSDEALADLMTALDEGHDFATGLDQRLSQSGFALNPAALMRQKGAGGRQVSEFGPQTDFSKRAEARHPEKRGTKNVEAALIAETQSGEPLEADELDIEVEND